jgi:hypothetical protein
MIIVGVIDVIVGVIDVIVGVIDIIVMVGVRNGIIVVRDRIIIVGNRIIVVRVGILDRRKEVIATLQHKCSGCRRPGEGNSFQGLSSLQFVWINIARRHDLVFRFVIVHYRTAFPFNLSSNL